MPVKEKITRLVDNENDFLTVELTKQGSIVLIYTHYSSDKVHKITFTQENLRLIIAKFKVIYLQFEVYKERGFYIRFENSNWADSALKKVVFYNTRNKITLNSKEIEAIEQWLNLPNEVK